MARIANLDRGKHRRISAAITAEAVNARTVTVTVANSHGGLVQPATTAAAAASAVTAAGRPGSGLVRFWIPGNPVTLAMVMTDGGAGDVVGVYETAAGAGLHLGGYVALMRVNTAGQCALTITTAAALAAQPIIIEAGLDSIEITAVWA